MITGHGGNINQLADKLQCPVHEIVDMSCNLNPLGTPFFIIKIISNRLDTIHHLPEPDAISIRQGFARHHDINPDKVIAGNGTTWFIFTLPHALELKNAVIAGPTYADYKDACYMHNIPWKFVLADVTHQFVPDLDAISQLAKTADAVFICNPNNPTGTLLSKEQIESLATAHEDTLFIIDESYLPFVDQAKEISLVSENKYQNVLVLSSMSKIFAIPGLRTGFISGPEPVILKLMKFYQPWSVNALAQAVICDIFEQSEKIDPFYQETRAFVQRERQSFLTTMALVKGIELFDSTTCFILAKLTNRLTSDQLCEATGGYKILIRDCANFDGLSDKYIRFSLKNTFENKRLARVIQTVLETSHD